jgi:hypothetical protein
MLNVGCPRLLDKIKSPMEALSTGGGVSRIIHLNRNERMLRSIRAELDEAYRDFVVRVLSYKNGT